MAGRANRLRPPASWAIICRLAIICRRHPTIHSWPLSPASFISLAIRARVATPARNAEHCRLVSHLMPGSPIPLDDSGAHGGLHYLMAALRGSGVLMHQTSVGPRQTDAFNSSMGRSTHKSRSQATQPHCRRLFR